VRQPGLFERGDRVVVVGLRPLGPARLPGERAGTLQKRGSRSELVGEREFSVAPIVRSFELGHSKRDALYRLDRLTSDLGLDRDRARGWTIGQTIAWAMDDDPPSEHLDVVRWLLEAG